MRLRRRADKVRAIGWVNLLVAVIWSVIQASEGIVVLAVGAIWAAAVMALVYAIGWAIDKRADRVVTR